MTKIWYFLPVRRIVFIVYPGFELLDVSGPTSVFNNANRALATREEPRCYGVDLVSTGGGPVWSSSGIVVETRRIADLSSETIDTLLVAGAEREPLLQAMADAASREELPKMAGSAKRFGSVCTGAFILAALGLLDGHRVATHWDDALRSPRPFPL